MSKRIYVKTQEEFDNALASRTSDSDIFIKGGTMENPIHVRVNRYSISEIYAIGKAVVLVSGNVHITAMGKSIIFSRCGYNGRPTVFLRDRAQAYSYYSDVTVGDNAYAELYGDSSACAIGKSKVLALGESVVSACDESSVTAYDYATVHQYDKSTVTAFEGAVVHDRRND